MDFFLARQPIFNQKQKIYGYELLFRNGLENSFPGIDGDVATSNVLVNTFFSLEFQKILAGRPALINFTRRLILNRSPLLFPKEHIFVEVLENIDPDDELVKALKEIRDKGFRIALDDFVFHEKFQPLIDLCHIIKVDIIATPLETLDDFVKGILDHGGIKLLAEKVETHEEFSLAKEMGFTLFQGYFFSKPEIMSGKDISSGQIARLKLMKECARKDPDLEYIGELIKSDVAISYKMLKFINSAYFSRPNPINTIKEAITFMGSEELLKFVNLVVISVLNDTKPNELIRLSVIRAKMCELCGDLLETGFSSEELFMLGLFSLVDAILDRDMDEVLAYLDFSPAMKAALSGKSKGFNKVFQIARAFERGRWDDMFFTVMANTPLEARLPEIYLDALDMADSIFL